MVKTAKILVLWAVAFTFTRVIMNLSILASQQVALNQMEDTYSSIVSPSIAPQIASALMVIIWLIAIFISYKIIKKKEKRKDENI